MSGPIIEHSFTLTFGIIKMFLMNLLFSILDTLKRKAIQYNEITVTKELANRSLPIVSMYLLAFDKNVTSKQNVLRCQLLITKIKH